MAFSRCCLRVIICSGEVPTDTTRPAIIIANHQVDADWWYIWQGAIISFVCADIWTRQR